MGEITEGRTELEARRQVLLFFFALASRPDLVRQIEENGVLAGGKIDHDNLFQTTSRALTLHQLLASGAFVDREMTSLWQLFAGQDTGEEMDSYPVAEEFGPFADRRVVSPLTRMEFQFRAGTPAFYLGTDKRRMLVQDLVTVPGSRDPFSVTPASSFSLVREYSPLVAVLTPVREEDWAVVSGLGEAFVDTLAILGDPIEARFLGNDPMGVYVRGNQRCFDIRHNLAFTDWLGMLVRDNQKSVGPLFLATPGRVGLWLAAMNYTVDMAVSFRGEKVFAETRGLAATGSKGFGVEGITNADFVKRLLMALESEFLSALDLTRMAAEAAALTFVSGLESFF